MSAFFDLLVNLCLFLFGLAALGIAIRSAIQGLHIVQEGYQVVIERLGEYARVSGPGLVWVTPWLERISHHLQTRSIGEVYEFTEMWFQGYLPISIEFALSYRIDFRHLPRDLGKELAYQSHPEWEKRAKAHMQRVLQDIVSTFQFTELIGPVPIYRTALESKLRERLPESLRAFGILLSDFHDIELKAVHLPESLQESLTKIKSSDIDAQTQLRIIDSIIQKYPGLSENALYAIASLVTGQNTGAGQIVPALLVSGANENRPFNCIGKDTPNEIEQRQLTKELGDGNDAAFWSLKRAPENP